MSTNDTAYPSFWDNLREHADAPAILDSRSGDAITYQQLADLTNPGSKDQPAILRRTRKMLVCLPMRSDIGGISCYLTFLRSGHAIHPIGPHVESVLNRDFLDKYRPGLVLWREDEGRPAVIESISPRNGYSYSYQDAGQMFGYRIARCTESEREGNTGQEEIYQSMALALPTSGSTGSAKTVRLSYRNVSANAWQIAQALDIDARERAVLSLPLQYAYGLSVLHSALSVGACLIVSGRTVMDPEFWGICRAMEVTTLPTVPTMLRFMESIGMEDMKLPSLRKITIAGAAMDQRTREWMVMRIAPKQIGIYSMYGQTEACARISVLPAEEFASRPDSVGRALPGGRLNILPSTEIAYQGPNVMLGYASSRSDLISGDETAGILKTGDLGVMDASGNLYITGRVARICKLLGARINLADIEQRLSHVGEVAVVSDDEVIRIFHTSANESQVCQSAIDLADHWRIPRGALIVKRIERIPRTDSGKIRYPDLCKA